MKFKGVLLDIDNTLYDYFKPHHYALNKALTYLSQELGCSISVLEKCYMKARHQIHLQLHGTAASHSRLLYFQVLCEMLDKESFIVPHKAHQIYWDAYIKKMELRKGVLEFLNAIKNKPVCLVTDLISEIQFRKVKALKLNQYIQYMVTSEEVGKEKPHKDIFQAALRKLKLRNTQVVMIGDDFKKDVLGAHASNIYSVWFNAQNEKRNVKHLKMKEVNSFQEVRSFLELN